MQQIRMKFIACKALHINYLGKETYNVVVYSELVITLQVGSHTAPSNMQHFNIKSMRFL